MRQHLIVFFLIGISGLWYVNQHINTLKYLTYIHLFGWLFSKFIPSNWFTFNVDLDWI